MNKYPKTGCLAMTALIFCGLLAIVLTKPGSRGYLDSAYQKDYEWNGVEVGTMLRLPIGSILPTGRRMAIVAFPSGSIDDARVLYESRGTEVPSRATFVTGTNSTVVYSGPNEEKDMIFDLQQLAPYPLRSKSSPKALLEARSPTGKVEAQPAADRTEDSP